MLTFFYIIADNFSDPTHAAFSGKSIPSAILAGSKCETYLLEKSRVVSHEEEERGYHIFYQLLAASDDVKAQFWDGLLGTNNESFTYVGYTDTDTIEGKKDAERFQLTLDALAIVGVKDDTLKDMMRALCIVLQLGNLTFEADPNNEENAIITSTNELEQLSALMGVEHEVVEKALTERSVKARNEVFKVPLNVEKAQDSCNAFAKEIYSIAFDWLVGTINDATCAENNYTENPQTDFGLIGLLDIFGFESFVVNRFEQLCINYANEKLQQKFTLDIFRSVQQEYEYEGIELGEVTYNDNADVLSLIEGRMGLISVLNEECVRPKGNDTAFVTKVYAMNKESDVLYKGRLFRDYEFGIKHYAGDVTYDANNFVTKNNDTLPDDLNNCRKASSNSIVSAEIVRKVGNSKPKTLASAAKRGFSRGKSSIASATVWTKFKTQLGELMVNISETRSRYIRCVKPNKMKQPRVMQHVSSVEQLRCAGVVAAVTISRSAFPNRLEHDQVFDRFMCLEKSFVRKFPDGDSDQIMEDINTLLGRALKSLEIEKDGKKIQGFVCGKTRAYFRAGSLEYLENKRLHAFGDLAKDIQRIVRGFVARSKFCRFRNIAIFLQAQARGNASRVKYLEMRAASIKIQCWTRSAFSRATLSQLKKDYSVTRIQTTYRCIVALRKFKTLRAAVVTIQACARGARQRPLYRAALAEAVEEAKLENQLKSLQRKLEEAESKRIEAEKRAEEGGKTVIVYKAKEGESKGDESVDSNQAQTAVQSRPSQAAISEHQQTLMDESGKMLEYLRKEVFKLRSQNSQLRTDFELLKENNQRLMDANASAGASFAALNQHAKQMSKTNAKLKADVTKYKKQAHQLSLTQVELKEELKMKQGTYIAEVHSRLQYQKTMSSIVDLVQERCNDHRLVEKVLELSDECESDYMSGPTGVDFNTPTPTKSRAGGRGTFTSPPASGQSFAGRFKKFLFE